MSVLSHSPSPLASNGPEDGSIKTVVEDRIDEEGRTVRITRKIRMRRVTETVPAVVAERRTWSKYGESSKDRAGPNLATTILGEPVFLKLALDRNFDQEAAQGERTGSVVEAKSVVCQYCQGSHWSVKCPYKATFSNMKSERDKEKEKTFQAERDKQQETDQVPDSSLKGKYVPPSMRGREGQAPLSPALDSTMPGRESGYALRLSNLAGITTDADIRNLCSRLGNVTRVYVAKEHKTNKCRGFAYVTFELKDDAEKALKRLNGHRYGNLIMKADWSEPQQQ
jgi:translation initiation factor 3 subunit G